MQHIQRWLSHFSALFSVALALQACRTTPSGVANAAPIRGTIADIAGDVLTVATPAGSVRIALPHLPVVATAVQSDRSRLADGSFLGITSVAQPDGSQRAVEVHIFPETMRGAGEGSYAWDLPGAGTGGSKMTNGTATSSRMTNGTVTAESGGTSLTLLYNEGTSAGSQTIAIPPDIPVVALEPGGRSDLALGAPVFVVAQKRRDGTLTASRILVGKGGVIPPM